MTMPDGNTVAVLVVNVIGYVWVWHRTRKKDEREVSVRDSQHGMMWKDYMKRHGIANGEGGS